MLVGLLRLVSLGRLVQLARLARLVVRKAGVGGGKLG